MLYKSYADPMLTENQAHLLQKVVTDHPNDQFLLVEMLIALKREKTSFRLKS